MSYGGSWLTRVHTALIGVGCVIDVLTGLVLDAHVMSSHCQACENKKTVQKEDNDKFAVWERQHLGSGECDRNFFGTAGMIEVHASKIMWARGVMKHNMRYTIVVSEGDSKSFNAVIEMHPYGPLCIIEKEDCINHVCKRLGTALRNLVVDASKRKITLGGRGEGRLTENVIRCLSIYFTRAVRSNTTSSEMRDAIMASVYHVFSTDEKPQHHLCPKGPSSWCFYNAAEAKDAVPGPHSIFRHTSLDKNLLGEHILPVYRRLTDDALIKRCRGMQFKIQMNLSMSHGLSALSISFIVRKGLSCVLC